MTLLLIYLLNFMCGPYSFDVDSEHEDLSAELLLFR